MKQLLKNVPSAVTHGIHERKNLNNARTVKEWTGIKNNMNLKELLFVSISATLLVVLFFVTNYPEREKKINHHFCVEVYGLDENCR